MGSKLYNQFKFDVCQHLVCYEVSQYGESVINGKWFNRKTKRNDNVSHILCLSDDTKDEKERVVKEYNLLESVKCLPFLLSKKLHQYAHHLNSSQIMCYNLFRPQLENDGKIKKPLKRLLNRLIGDIEETGIAVFEYVDSFSEESNGKTNFDFFVEDRTIKIYFEVKFTEDGFANCKNDKSHQDKFVQYEDLMRKSGIFKNSVLTWDKLFRKHYQLIRNAINVGENSFVIIITDQWNLSTNNQIERFKKEMLNESAPFYSQLIFKTWQELVELAKESDFSNDHLKEFEEKYLNYRSQNLI